MEFHKTAVTRNRSCSRTLLSSSLFVCNQPFFFFSSFYINPPVHFPCLFLPSPLDSLSCSQELLKMSQKLCRVSQSHPCTKISRCYDTVIHPFLSVLQDLGWFLQWPIIQELESSSLVLSSLSPLYVRVCVFDCDLLLFLSLVVVFMLNSL